MNISSTATIAFGILVKREPKLIKQAGNFEAHVDAFIAQSQARGEMIDEETFPAKCVELIDPADDTTEYIYAVNGSVYEVTDGLLSFSKLEVTPKQVEAFKDWCLAVGIKNSKPKWHLVSQTSY